MASSLTIGPFLGSHLRKHPKPPSAPALLPSLLRRELMGQSGLGCRVGPLCASGEMAPASLHGGPSIFSGLAVKKTGTKVLVLTVLLTSDEL